MLDLQCNISQLTYNVNLFMLMPHFGLLHVFHVLMALEESIYVGAYLLERDLDMLYENNQVFPTVDPMPANRMLSAMETCRCTVETYFSDELRCRSSNNKILVVFQHAIFASIIKRLVYNRVHVNKLKQHSDILIS